MAGNWNYPNMCRLDHEEIGYKDSSAEDCPLCQALLESQEQARLLGICGSKEAALLARLEESRRDADRLAGEVVASAKVGHEYGTCENGNEERGIKCRSWEDHISPDMMGALAAHEKLNDKTKGDIK